MGPFWKALLFSKLLWIRLLSSSLKVWGWRGKVLFYSLLKEDFSPSLSSFSLAIPQPNQVASQGAVLKGFFSYDPGRTAEETG